MSLMYSIAQRLPDIPRWVEARDLLLCEQCEIFGLQEEPDLSLAIRDTETGSVFIVGTPEEQAIRAAVQHIGSGDMVVPPEQAARIAALLPGWSSSRAPLYLLPNADRLPKTSAGTVDFVDISALGDSIPDDLIEELRSAAARTRIAATLVDGKPVSFCYAGAVTETLWDISIDTLPEHRRNGYAALCVAFMIRYMHAQGKQPVWAAVEENPASWRLAEKLGFVAVDEIVLFEPG